MPLFDFACPAGHIVERFFHTAAQRDAEPVICACGERMERQLSVGRGLTYFEEGKPRTIWNLGHEPVVIRSHREHEAAMRKAGVTWATRGTGERGCWT